MNSKDDVTMRKRATVIMWPVIPAAVVKHIVIGSCTAQKCTFSVLAIIPVQIINLYY